LFFFSLSAPYVAIAARHASLRMTRYTKSGLAIPHITQFAQADARQV